MLKALKSLFSSSRELKSDEYTVFTVSEGREYVTHDGLGLKVKPEQPDQEWDEAGSAGAQSGIHQDHASPTDVESEDMEFESDTMDLESGPDATDSGNTMAINPATGLFMLNDVVDTGGNFYGFSDDSFGIDDSSAFDDSSMFDNSCGIDDSFGIDDNCGIDDSFGIDDSSMFNDEF